ncbi:MAG: alpha-amylase, partial [Spirochaetales bacterium]|nr:alpha-amylase [Spirochaetales bacterium]
MNRFHPFPAAVRVVTRVPGPPREFHVAKSARDVYGFEEGGFSVQGHLLFADIRAARDFAMRMNTVRRAALHPERTVRAGDVYAMGLIDEIFHYVINLYLEQYGRGVVDQLETTLSRELGEDRLSRLLLTFSSRFPTAACYRDAESPQESLDRNVDGVTGRHVALEELIVMWIGNRNPAYTPLIELFDEKIIAVDTGYERAMHIIGDFFRDLPTFGPDDQTLLNMLRSPALAHPDDLQAQLEYIRSRWASLIGAFLERLLRSL